MRHEAALLTSCSAMALRPSLLTRGIPSGTSDTGSPAEQRDDAKKNMLKAMRPLPTQHYWNVYFDRQVQVVEDPDVITILGNSPHVAISQCQLIETDRRKTQRKPRTVLTKPLLSNWELKSKASRTSGAIIITHPLTRLKCANPSIFSSKDSSQYGKIEGT